MSNDFISTKNIIKFEIHLLNCVSRTESAVLRRFLPNVLLFSDSSRRGGKSCQTHRRLMTQKTNGKTVHKQFRNCVLKASVCKYLGRNCATLCFVGNIKKSLSPCFEKRGKTNVFDTPKMTFPFFSLKFYSIYLFTLSLFVSWSPSTDVRVETSNRGWLWFFMDFNWPYRNDADINISFNDVFAFRALSLLQMIVCVCAWEGGVVVVSFQVPLKTSSPKHFARQEE